MVGVGGDGGGCCGRFALVGSGRGLLLMAMML